MPGSSIPRSGHENAIVKNPDHANQLFAALGAEIRQARAGSDGGQFPILDLIGNLRDEAAGKPELAAIHSACAEAWEKMVRIVESGQPFSAENIEWLNALLTQIKTPAGEAP